MLCLLINLSSDDKLINKQSITTCKVLKLCNYLLSHLHHSLILHAFNHLHIFFYNVLLELCIEGGLSASKPSGCKSQICYLLNYLYVFVVFLGVVKNK